MADDASPRGQARHINDLIEVRLSRRGLLGAFSALPLLTLAPGCATAAGTGPSVATAPAKPAGFASVAATTADTVTVPAGYRWSTLIAWGDALFEGMAPFNADTLTREEQERRFGSNNDMLAIFPARWTFPKATDQQRFFLCANHEYFDPAMMFPSAQSPWELTPARVAAMYAAMGVSVVELSQQGQTWRALRGGLNRRITPFTPVMFSGPAAQHRWIRSAAAQVNAAEPGAGAGLVACGTHSNCAGGETPWGTYLTAEENFNNYLFNSNISAGAAAAAADPALQLDAENFGYPLERGRNSMGAPRQFDLAANPNVGALYGWTVEIDPYDPTWAPRKRTALGRRKGECANTALSRDGRVAVYSGDDQVNEFVYKFVSKNRFNAANRTANRDLLDDGALYVAQFDEDGTGRWLALTVANANAAADQAGYPQRFADLGDVMVRAREAARLMGATPMDRPEDVEALHTPDWVGTGSVLVVCTKNTQQGFARGGNPRRLDPDKPNRAQSNLAGHIIRIDEAGGDCGALTFKWDVFALAGDPNAAAPISTTPTGTRLHVDVAVNGAPTFSGDRFACPDNVCFDSAGFVWISTDGSDEVFGDCNDMVVVAPVSGAEPRPVKRFLVCPVGAEVCGPMLSPDETAFFCAIQHPGENNAQRVRFSDERWEKPGTKPGSTFPDGGWPRPAVVVVTRDDGGKVWG
jgi:hypothetical protein